MKFSSLPCGLSARQRTTPKVTNAHVGVYPLIGLFVLTLMFSSCHEKSSGQHANESETKSTTVVADRLDKPKVSIQVNRRYDDKGNMIGFDSTYSSYYSNVRGDTAQMDSLMSNFDRYFDLNHSSFFKNEFTPLFFTDSLRYPDFFHNDFFMKRYELNDLYMKDMMKRMDSIKNEFYQEHSKKQKEERKS